jgi:hypothetical protein
VRTNYRRRRVFRLPLLVMALPIATIGVVYLAASDVPLTDAGVTQTPVAVSTTLDAAAATMTADPTSGYDAVLSATLTTQGLPVVDQTIAFAADGQTCTASTDALGTASCGVANVAVAPSSYSASFTGNDSFGASSATGSVDS